MPFVEAFGPTSQRAQTRARPRGDAAARGYGVLPTPSLEWNEDVARATEHLYARVKHVVPAIE